MGREVRRVPLEFDHPEGQVWPGFLGREITEPPEGEGWQLWKTVSEGSPASPVFATDEEVAEWMVNDARGLSRASSMDVARRFIEEGWAPTGFIGPGERIISGVEYVGGTEWRPT